MYGREKEHPQEHIPARHPKPDAPQAKRAERLPHPSLTILRAQLAPETLQSQDVLQLQRKIGNRAVGRLLNGLPLQEEAPQAIRPDEPIQRKLTVGPARDAYEQEADQMASRVLAMPRGFVSPLQRQTAEVEEEEELVQEKPLAQSITPLVRRQELEEEEEVQMEPMHQPAVGAQGGAVGSEVEHTIQRERGRGASLTDEVRAPMENAFGAYFGGVRLHTDNRADTLNRTLNARAFTVKDDIFFRQGEYRPDSSGGQGLLAHELTHVVQQRDGGRPHTQRRYAQSAQRQATDAIIQRVFSPLALLKEKAPSTKSDSREFGEIRKFASTWGLHSENPKSSPARKLTILTQLREGIAAWKKKYPLARFTKRGKVLATITKELERQPLMIMHDTQKQMATELESAVSSKRTIYYGAQLENHDDCHREATILEWCWQRWVIANAADPGAQWDPTTGTAPPLEFYTYVTGLEDAKDQDLVDKVQTYVRSKMRGDDQDGQAEQWVAQKKEKTDNNGHIPLIPRITYLAEGEGEEGRDQYRLHFDGIKASCPKGEELKSRKKYIYAMSTGMEFYARQETANTQLDFHHSSFMGGSGVGAAGKIENLGGSFLKIDLDSGHYQPKTQHMANALLGLGNKGVPVDKVIAYPIFELDNGLYGDTFLKLTQTVQTIPSKSSDLKILKSPKDNEGNKKFDGVLKKHKFKEKNFKGIADILEASGQILDDMRKLKV